MAISAAAVVAGALAIPIAGGAASAANLIPATVAEPTSSSSIESLVTYISTTVAPKHGVKLTIKNIDDPNVMNQATASNQVNGELENPNYLQVVLSANPGYHLRVAAKFLKLGSGIWSSKYKTLADLPTGAKVELGSNAQDISLGLDILVQAKLITLKNGTNPNSAGISDIASNPKQLTFPLIDDALMPRTLGNVDAVVGYNAFFDAAKTPQKYLIANLGEALGFAFSLIVPTQGDNKTVTKKLTAIFSDPLIQTYIRSHPKIMTNQVLPIR